MKKPNLFIVGAPRCGTTSLYRYCQQHPEVYMAECKEPEFFATDLPFRHARTNEEEYLSLFSGARDGQRIGEASTFYLFSKVAAYNIKRFSPRAKIIIMLRRPVDQMLSFHNMMLSLYWEGSEDLLDFAEALAAEVLRKQGLRLPKNNTMPKECYFYREIVKYTEQVKRYLEVFGRENVHIIIYDDLKRNVVEMYKRVCDFLNVNRDSKVDLIRHNTIGHIQSQTVFKLLRHPPNSHRCIKTLLPSRWNQIIFAFLWRLNESNGRAYRINSSLKIQLEKEFTSELSDLSHLIERDLIKEWSSNDEKGGDDD